jgi:hypothetical protein
MTSNLPARAGTVRDTTWKNRRLGSTLLLSNADVELLNSLHPLCAVCNKPVETLSWRRDIAEPWVVFTATCHGATEETVVPFSQFHEIMAGAIQGAKAFDMPVLTYDEVLQRAALEVLQTKKAFRNG